jgi:hypothetical protein
MSGDTFIKVTRQGLGKNLFNSVIGALIGLVMFLGSFVMLWMNEGQINWADVANSSTAIDAATLGNTGDGKFVAATGQIVSAEQLGDPPYLKPGPYIHLARTVEMYAWKETKESETTNQTGGGSTTTTKYSYTREWTSSPQDSSTFEVPDGHTNPQQMIESSERTVAQAQVGAYTLDMNTLDLPSTKPLALNAALIDSESSAKLVGGYLFSGSGTLAKPQLGDLRIQYQALANNLRATVFGVRRGDQLTPYLFQGQTNFYRALAGDRATAIVALRNEHDALIWIFRIIGFVLMWLGLSLMFTPITAVLNILPFLGNLGGKAIGLVTFGVAFVLSSLMIIVSAIAHSLLALTILLILILAGLWFMGQRAKQNRPAATNT